MLSLGGEDESFGEDMLSICVVVVVIVRCRYIYIYIVLVRKDLRMDSID